ncbi:MAG: glutamine--fructose-6-phosphate transaminase (isomerizing) [Gammaproteobacteria bacterium]
MCGIIGAVGQRDMVGVLLDGLNRLEYRGYDSAGIAVIDEAQTMRRVRTSGKVQKLHDLLDTQTLAGNTGIAHTRWATHGEPTERNAHPHLSQDDRIAVVHNGIIENFQSLKEQLLKQGYQFISDTDTEVVVHTIHQYLQQGEDFLTAVRNMVQHLIGAYALAIMHQAEPKRLIAVRCGCPLIIGLGDGENFIASDTHALLPVTQRFIYLEEGDIADVRVNQVKIYNSDGVEQTRKVHTVNTQRDASNRGNFRHFMLKEIFEQPQAVTETLAGRLTHKHIFARTFGTQAEELFPRIRKIQIVACGTSYHAGLVGRYWLESLAKIPCQVEIASEIRYRSAVVEPDTLFLTLSQSGETADTLAALRQAKTLPYAGTLAICNVPESSLVRESDLVFMMRAGVEIGVASTKAFTTQLVALLMLSIVLAKYRVPQQIDEAALIRQLLELPRQMEQALALSETIQVLAERFADKEHALFLGRGLQFPIALEGALKLKEISYIHAEAYPAGELKHGPLALVDKHMLVVALAANDEWLEKLISNLYEVQTRGGQLILFADKTAEFKNTQNATIIPMPMVSSLTAPIVYIIPLQLLAYYVAVLKGTDVDQPRNLAKSVTVE